MIILAFGKQSGYILGSEDFHILMEPTIFTIFVIAAIISAAASLFLLIGIYRCRRGQSQSSQLPSIAVIVAGRNEEATLRRCLQSILLLDYSSELIERIYVDDGSTDGSWGIANDLSVTTGGLLKVMKAPPNLDGIGPKKNALRAAIKSATAEILLFTDADAEVSPEWAKAVVKQFDTKIGAVAGLFYPSSHQTIKERFYRFERLMHGIISAGCIGWGFPSSVCGANFAYRRRCYEELGGFAEAYRKAGDDDMMAQAIRRQGWQVRFVMNADAVVKDLRTPSAQEFQQAKKRHQSTARAYPFGWLLFFWIVILAQIGYLIGWGSALFRPEILPITIGAFIVRYGCDFLLLSLFSSFNSLKNWKRGFLLIELIFAFLLARATGFCHVRRVQMERAYLNCGYR